MYSVNQHQKYKRLIKQFLSYFIVGGVSALVEWSIFFICDSLFLIHYQISTIISFVIATSVNIILGRKLTFKSGNLYKKKLSEILSVFMVSALGLVFNLLLMKVLVDFWGFNSETQRRLDKIVSTGIVFFWNFIGRRFLIYRDI